MPAVSVQQGSEITPRAIDLNGQQPCPVIAHNQQIADLNFVQALQPPLDGRDRALREAVNICNQIELPSRERRGRLIERDHFGAMAEAPKIYVERTEKGGHRHRIDADDRRPRQRAHQAVRESAVSGTDVEYGDRAIALQPEPVRHEIDLIHGIEEVSAEEVTILERDSGRAK